MTVPVARNPRNPDSLKIHDEGIQHAAGRRLDAGWRHG
jgi:hypothetical protein